MIKFFVIASILGKVKKVILSNPGKYSLIFLAYCALAIVMTWPFARHMRTYIDDPVDPSLVAWILHWNFHVMAHGLWTQYFNPPIFYPYQQTLLFSETFLTQSIIGLPFYAVTKDLLITYNALVLSSFIFSAYSAFLLINYYTKRKIASFFGGFIYGFALFRFGHIGHLQILSTYFIPLSILFFEKLLENPNKKNVLLFSICFILLSHASLYQMVFTSITLLLIALYRYLKNRGLLTKNLVIHLIASGAIVFLGIIPTYYGYYRFSKEYNVQRDITENVLYSADLTSIVNGPSKLYVENCPSIEKTHQKNLYCYETIFMPGITAAILAVLALVSIRKNEEGKWNIKPARIATTILYASLLVISYVFALGPQLKINGENTRIPLPYIALYYVYPPAQGTRVPGRWDMIFYLCLGILVAFTIMRILRRNLKPLHASLLLTGIFTLLMFEYYAVPIHTRPAYYYKTPAVSYVKNNPEIKVLARLPMWVDKYGNNFDDTDALLEQTYHQKKILNGYSGYNPDGHIKVSELLTDKFPDATSVKLLNALKVDHVMMTRKKYDAEMYRIQPHVDNGDMTLDYVDDQYYVYKVNDRRTNLENGHIAIKAKIESYIKEKHKLFVNAIAQNDSVQLYVSPTPTPLNEKFQVFVNGKEFKTKDSIFKQPIFIDQSEPYVKKLEIRNIILKQGDSLQIKHNGIVLDELKY